MGNPRRDEKKGARLIVPRRLLVPRRSDHPWQRWQRIEPSLRTLRKHFSPAALLVAVLFVAGCTGSRASRYGLPDDPNHVRPSDRGVLHTVEKGQTLWRIAHTYGVSLQSVAELNDIEDPARIRVGQALWIPGATRLLKVEAASVRPSPTRDVAKNKPPPAARPPSRTKPPAGRTPPASGTVETRPEVVRTHKERFIWPVKGVLYSRFGVREGVRHDGIDIAAPEGTPVVAADDGEVIFAGVQRGYGNLVLVKHDDGLVTIYAHNERNLVDAGKRVRRGDRIATVGRTGRATGPHVHFEVRENRLPRNPLFFLP